MFEAAISALLAASAALQAHDVPAVIPVPADGMVRVRDLARVSRGGQLIVMRIKGATTLSAQRQAQLVRNRLPGMAFVLRYHQAVRIDPGSFVTLAARAECSAAANAIPAGQMLDSADLVPVTCDVEPHGGWLRRVGGGYQARIAIPAGTPLGRPLLDQLAPIAPATAVVVRTRIGPVTIERQAETVQPGRAGRRVFVRTQDGAVLAAPLAAEQPESRP